MSLNVSHRFSRWLILAPSLIPSLCLTLYWTPSSALSWSSGDLQLQQHSSQLSLKAVDLLSAMVTHFCWKSRSKSRSAGTTEGDRMLPYNQGRYTSTSLLSSRFLTIECRASILVFPEACVRILCPGASLDIQSELHHTN